MKILSCFSDTFIPALAGFGIIVTYIVAWGVLFYWMNEKKDVSPWWNIPLAVIALVGISAIAARLDCTPFFNIQ